MKLALVQLLVEIVEAGNLSAAARTLNVTRSNVSRQLKLLERQIGVQLFRRSTRQLELTQAGETLYQFGCRLRDDMHQTKASLEHLSTSLKGHLRISIPTGFGRVFAGPMVMAFAAREPGITLSVLFDNSIEDMIASRIDVAVRIAETPPLSNVVHKVFPMHLRLFASQEYLDRHGPITHPDELQDHAIIARPYPGRNIELKLKARSQSQVQRHITLHPSLESADFPFLADAVCQGLGVGLLPAYLSKADRYQAMQAILPDYRIDTVAQSIYIMSLPIRFPSPATRALIAFLCEQITQVMRDID